MRRNIGILAGVSAAAVAAGLYSAFGDQSSSDQTVTPPQVEAAVAAPDPAPASAPQPETATADAAAAQAAAEVERLAQELGDRRTEAEGLGQRIATLEADLANRDGTLRERETEIADLTRLLAERGAEIAGLRAEIETLQSRFAFDERLAAKIAPEADAFTPASASADQVPAPAPAAVASFGERPMTAIHFEVGSASVPPDPRGCRRNRHRRGAGGRAHQARRLCRPHRRSRAQPAPRRAPRRGGGRAPARGRRRPGTDRDARRGGRRRPARRHRRGRRRAAQPLCVDHRGAPADDMTNARPGRTAPGRPGA
jgi:hypothetical protein